MFHVGEYIVYGTAGVCRLVGIENMKIPGEKTEKEYYHIVPLYDTGDIYLPVDSDKVFLRRAMNEEEARQLLKSVGQVETIDLGSGTAKEMSTLYSELIRSHDPKKWMALCQYIYEKQKRERSENKRTGSVDDAFIKKGEKLLFGELANALQISPQEVEEYIDNLVEGTSKI